MIDFADVDGEAAFEDTTAPSELAYTALTRDSNTVGLAFGSPAISNSDAGVVTAGSTQADEWWDTLDCSKRNNALFSGADTRRDSDDTDTAGICQDYDQLGDVDIAATFDLDGDGDVDDDTDDTFDAQDLVVHAFHWDMLTGDEMVAAAKAGGLSSTANYKVKFSGLTDQEIVNVMELYEDIELL